MFSGHFLDILQFQKVFLELFGEKYAVQSHVGGISKKCFAKQRVQNGTSGKLIECLQGEVAAQYAENNHV